MKLAIIAAAILTLTAGTAQAGTYRYIVGDAESTVLLDLSTIKTTVYPRATTGWVLTVYAHRTTIGNTSADYMLNRYSVDCSADTMSITSVAEYVLNSNSAVSTTTDAFPKASPIVPDSWGAGIEKVACAPNPASDDFQYDAATMAGIVRGAYEAKTPKSPSK